jgi:hypothetical protein
MPIKAGEYPEILKPDRAPKWRTMKGEPEGVEEALLHKHADGSYTHLLRVKEGWNFASPLRMFSMKRPITSTERC